MGVAGRDPVGDRIYGFTAKDTWDPYATRKRTLCGTLHHFNFFDPGGDEADWNNFIIPSEPFRRLLTDPLTFGWAEPDGNGVHDCASANDCMEAEITPDEHFYGNPWFPKVHGDNRDESFLEGELLCTYGPWVGDDGHGNRPEIHPSELLWWQMPWPFGTLTHLMLLQDDSNRYDRSSDFDSPDSPPDDWRPWSQFPRTGEFSLAFEVDTNPTGQPLTFDILEPIEPGHVVTKTNLEARADADNGTQHAIAFNGEIVLQIRELQTNDNDLGVQFEEVCRNDASTRLQGYVTLTSMVGEGDRGDEGYHVLLIAIGPEEDLDDNRPDISVEPAKVVTMGKILRQTLHPAVIDNKTELLADLQVIVMGNRDGEESDLEIVKVERVEGNQRRELVLTSTQRGKDSNEFQGVVKDVPVASGVMLELTTESGKVLFLTAPPVSLAPAIFTETLLRISDDPMTWSSMVAAAGGNPEESTPLPMQLVKISQWQLEVSPRYAPWRDGLASPEDDSPVAEELNEIIRLNDSHRLDELIGSSRPFSVEWSFEAKNLTTGEEVSVNTVGNAASNEVQVQILQDESITESLKITFPEEPENALFEMIVSAVIVDTLGNKAEVQHTLWSHELSGEDENQLVEYLIPTVAVLAGVSPDDLLADGRLDVQADESSRTTPDSSGMTARMLRLIAGQAAVDGRITVVELSSLVKGARLYGSQ